ncbi:MAG TPA: phospholipase D-like domain-containing protein, partial [Saprospiraceae bacterium]|nr:phospholipase D-like domain-containing protein [Saprospiraceae bacterium]
AKADFNLRFAIYTFTSDALANAIIERKKANLIIRGITDNNTDNSGKLTYLQQNGVDVIDHLPSSLMHHKYAVLDAEYQDSDPVVITGSHNWTWSADNINDESTMFIHDMDIAKLYVAEFNSRYCELAPWDCNLLDVKEYVNADIKIFPSITSGLVQLQSNGNNRITSIFIADQIGRPVYYTKSTLEMNLHMDISFLQPGIYFITVSGEQAGYATSKIIKI